MRILLTGAFLLSTFVSLAQMQPTYNQYVINPNLINPGYIDLSTRFGAAVVARKNWATGEGTPLTIAANGYYRLNDNHSVGMLASQDRVNDVNTTEVGLSYAYHLRISRRYWLGFGAKASFQARGGTADYVYFGPGIDPTLETVKSASMTAGTGLSLQSRNLIFGVSLPFMLNNAIGSRNSFKVYDNHLYTYLAYKLRASDNFIFTPSVMAKGVAGSPVNLSFDGHVLFSQLIWLGGTYRSDNTAGISAGVFLPKGIRVIYSYENSMFTGHTRFDNSHEITVNYAQSLETLPFQKRLYRKKNGKHYKNPDPSWRYEY